MKQIVNRFIEKHSLLFSGATVVVAVSGGPDSLALLHYLKQLERRWNLTLVAAHVDHMLRGAESEGDLQFVAQFCQDQNILFEARKINVSEYQKNEKVSLQVAARDCRYEYFKEVVTKYDADFLALAHHGDDQVETMLMRQVRGAYGVGLAGIPVKRDFFNCQIIRPFLCVSKDELIHYCKQEKLTPRIDPTNFTSKYTRNRFRNEVLPLLKKENPAVHSKFQQQSELLLEDQRLLNDLTTKAVEEAVWEWEENKVMIIISHWNHTPVPLQRRGFQLILNYLYKDNIPEISTVHIEDFLRFLKNSHPSGHLHFPNGLKIIKQYDKCILTTSEETSSKAYHFRLSIPGIVMLKKGKIVGKVIQEDKLGKLDENSAVFDFEQVFFPLSIRTRKQGDRISLISGTKKIKDLFIDAKVVREERNTWPIIVDGNGDILWVPGLKKSKIAYPTKETKRFLLLSYIENSRN